MIAGRILDQCRGLRLSNRIDRTCHHGVPAPAGQGEAPCAESKFAHKVPKALIGKCLSATEAKKLLDHLSSATD